jgi:hypothetical protein
VGFSIIQSPSSIVREAAGARVGTENIKTFLKFA